MNDIYQWLYNSYAEPELKDMARDQEAILRAFAEGLPISANDRLSLQDLSTGVRLDWGMEVFALGVRLGMALAAPREPAAAGQWLTSFLPEPGQPAPQQGGPLTAGYRPIPQCTPAPEAPRRSAARQRRARRPEPPQRAPRWLR